MINVSGPFGTHPTVSSVSRHFLEVPARGKNDFTMYICVLNFYLPREVNVNVGLFYW